MVTRTSSFGDPYHLPSSIEQTWLRDHGFTDSDQIYRSVLDFSHSCKISSPDYWRNHSLGFEAGRVQIIDGTERQRDKIVLVIRRALQAKAPSAEDKIQLMEQMQPLLQSQGIHPTISVTVKEDRKDAPEVQIEIPLSHCLKSPILSSQAMDKWSREPVVLLPNVSIEKFREFMTLIKRDKKESEDVWKEMPIENFINYMILADYYFPLDGRILSGFMDHFVRYSCFDRKPVGDIENTMWSLLNNPDLILTPQVHRHLFSYILNKYITASIDSGNPMERICEDLVSLPHLSELQKDHLDLDFHGNEHIHTEDLMRLSRTLPHVRSLNIQGTDIASIPDAWAGTLCSLNIRQSQVVHLPIMPQLEEFHAELARNLTDISRLNGLPHLRIVNVRRTGITAVPLSDCRALEEFDASGSRSLTDISGLNGLSCLRVIRVNETDIPAAPLSGCRALEEFHASFSDRLSNISGLNGLPCLRIIRVNETNIPAAPLSGCRALEEFHAKVPRLRDISGLNGLPHLRIVDVGSTRITEAPLSDCRALEEFHASDSKSLIDISGLNGLPHLRIVDVSSTHITEAPLSDCRSLEEFHAQWAFRLNDVSGLNGLPHLRVIIVNWTDIIEAPLSDCRALEKFHAKWACNLSDISGLVDLNKLWNVDVTYTAVPREFLEGSHMCPKDDYSRFREDLASGRSSPDRLPCPRHVANRLTWGFWFYSGMPEGDPDFGAHLFQRNPRDPACIRTLDGLLNNGWALVSKQTRNDILLFRDRLRMGMDPRQRLELLDSLDHEVRRLLLYAIWQAEGAPTGDPDYALHLVQRNPDDPILVKVIEKMARALE